MAKARLALALLLAGCCDQDAIIDTFPVPVELDGGVLIVGARAAELQGGVLRAVIDTSSPVTVVDQGGMGTSRRRLGLELLGIAPQVTRARFECVPALVAPIGAVGAGNPDDVAGVIGGDVLSRVAMRIDPTRRELRFFPDIAGDDKTHENACTAVMRVTLAGGGTFISGNDTITFAPTRVVLGACLWPEAEVGTEPSGADTLLVLATGLAPTVLSRTTAHNALGLDDAAIDALPETKLYLPGDSDMFGAVAKVATLPRMALTGPTLGRGACRELFLSRQIAGCPLAAATAGSCARAPCTESTCAAATVEVGGSVEVAIVPDTHPLLQALRNELRPEIAEIGGLLGMRAIGALVLDVDYPGSRVLARCAAEGAGCVARPRVTGTGTARAEELRDIGCFK